MAGASDASVDLAPDVAGPAFDALVASETDGTKPPHFIRTESKLLLPDTARQQYEARKDLGD